jgi:hypothetical protein
VHLPFRRIESAYKKPTILKKIYESNISDCKNCPLKGSCANAKGFKKLIDSMDKPLYEYMQQRIESRKGKQMKLLRSSTVEPVLGSLINYTGLKRINTKGIKQANKCMLMAAIAYNLKKLLKYKFKPMQATQKQLTNCLNNAFDTLFGRFKQQYAVNLLFQF